MRKIIFKTTAFLNKLIQSLFRDFIHQKGIKKRFKGDVHYSQGKYHLQKFNISGTEAEIGFFLERYKEAVSLKNNLGGSFNVEKGEIFFCFSNLKFLLTNRSDLFILKEIFVNRIYDFLSLSNDIVVIDIGMNVGLASLFFADKPYVSKVYGFEPFKPTFDQLQQNLQLNPHLAHKIIAYNYGLGKEDKHFSIPYSPEAKGLASIYEDNQNINKIQNKIFEKIEIKKSSSEIKSITQKHPEQRIVMKIDCEGAEYEIIEDLENHIDRNVFLILMEWHSGNPKNLLKKLKNTGFETLFNKFDNVDAGLITAFRSN